MVTIETEKSMMRQFKKKYKEGGVTLLKSFKSKLTFKFFKEKLKN